MWARLHKTVHHGGAETTPDATVATSPSEVRIMITGQAVRERIRAEYLEMPGMNLTSDQVARLCGMERSACQAVLDALVEAKFLTLTTDGTYVRRTDDVRPARIAPPPLHHHRPPRIIRRAS
jgi:hypothetical protein